MLSSTIYANSLNFKIKFWKVRTSLIVGPIFSILTGVLDLSGVEVIEEWHDQTLTEVDLHQGHCHVLPALDGGNLLQQGQSTAVLRLWKGLLGS